MWVLGQEKGRSQEGVTQVRPAAAAAARVGLLMKGTVRKSGESGSILTVPVPGSGSS